MSRTIKVTVSNAVAEALEAVARKDGDTVNGRPQVQPTIRTAVHKLLNRRGYSDEELSKPDQPRRRPPSEEFCKSGKLHDWRNLTTLSDHADHEGCNNCGARRMTKR